MRPFSFCDRDCWSACAHHRLTATVMALSSPCPSKPQSALLTLLQATSSTPDSEPTGLRWRLAVEKETCPPTSLPTGVNAETQAPKPPIALAASEILQPKLSSGVSAPSFCWFTQLIEFESPTEHDLSASITQITALVTAVIPR